MIPTPPPARIINLDFTRDHLRIAPGWSAELSLRRIHRRRQAPKLGLRKAGVERAHDQHRRRFGILPRTRQVRQNAQRRADLRGAEGPSLRASRQPVQNGDCRLRRHVAYERFGQGFKTTLMVRMVHAMVRRNLPEREEWSNEEWGLPVNQTDMLATYLAFGPIMMTGMRASTSTRCWPKPRCPTIESEG